MENNNQSLVQYIIYYSKHVLLNGILTILPLTLTIGLFMISARIIVSWLNPVQEFIEHPILFISTIAYKTIAYQLFLIFCIIFVIGIIVRTLLLKQFILNAEELLFKIPLVRPVYSGIKQLVHAFSVQDKVTFKKVVLVEFPRPGIFSVGFMTNEFPVEISPDQHKRFFNVFIPTTPNPTSGFFVILSEDNFTDINLTPQEAMAMVISGGIIQPDRFIKR